jgi:hypothetical protein
MSTVQYLGLFPNSGNNPDTTVGSGRGFSYCPADRYYSDGTIPPVFIDFTDDEEEFLNLSDAMGPYWRVKEWELSYDITLTSPEIEGVFFGGTFVGGTYNFQATLPFNAGQYIEEGPNGRIEDFGEGYTDLRQLICFGNELGDFVEEPSGTPSEFQRLNAWPRPDLKSFTQDDPIDSHFLINLRSVSEDLTILGCKAFLSYGGRNPPWFIKDDSETTIYSPAIKLWIEIGIGGIAIDIYARSWTSSLSLINPINVGKLFYRKEPNSVTPLAIDLFAYIPSSLAAVSIDAQVELKATTLWEY